MNAEKVKVWFFSNSSLFLGYREEREEEGVIENESNFNLY